MQLPIPKHLISILQPTGINNHAQQVTGDIICTCGCPTFAIQYVGNPHRTFLRVVEIQTNYYLIIGVVCDNCSQQHLIFDHDFHGWNGFVCTEEEKRQLPRPASAVWACPICQNQHHSMHVRIYSEGQEDFIEETAGEFPPNNWTEAFSWITIHLQCTSCLNRIKDWISYETM